MFVDSHCHLQSLEFSSPDESLETVLARAKGNGVDALLCVCIEGREFNTLCAIADAHDNIYVSYGTHPSYVAQNPVVAASLVQGSQSHPKCIALGETGLDYFYGKEPAQQTLQQNAFAEHIAAALQVKKSLIIHTRMAKDDTLGLLKEGQAEKVGGVMHCFTEDWDFAKACLDLGFYISFSGIITFKNAEVLREVVRRTPLDRLLIETDSPYLAPVPHRGKQNEPAYVKDVANMVAELKQVPVEAISEQTRDNFYRCFQI